MQHYLSSSAVFIQCKYKLLKIRIFIELLVYFDYGNNETCGIIDVSKCRLRVGLYRVGLKDVANFRLFYILYS